MHHLIRRGTGQIVGESLHLEQSANDTGHLNCPGIHGGSLGSQYSLTAANLTDIRWLQGRSRWAQTRASCEFGLPNSLYDPSWLYLHAARFYNVRQVLSSVIEWTRAPDVSSALACCPLYLHAPLPSRSRTSQYHYNTLPSHPAFHNSCSRSWIHSSATNRSSNHTSCHNSRRWKSTSHCLPSPHRSHSLTKTSPGHSTRGDPWVDPNVLEPSHYPLAQS